MSKTLLGMTEGGSGGDKIADWLEKRWFNEGVNKGIQHKAVLGLIRHFGSPEGSISMMPVGMAHRITDPDDILKLLQVAGKEYRGIQPRLTPLSSAKHKDMGESIMLKQIMPMLRKMSQNKPTEEIPNYIIHQVERLRRKR